MKNSLCIHCILLTCSIILISWSNIAAQTDSSFVFNIDTNDVCWSRDSTKLKFKIANNSTCNFTIRFGNESLLVTPGLTVYDFEFTTAKDSILIKNASTNSLVLKIKPPDKLPSMELVKPVGNCTFKKTQFVLCNAGKLVEEKPKDNEKPSESGNLFVPNYEQELEYLKRAAIFETTESEVCCPGTQELVFDYAAQCLVPTCDLEECICKKCKKIPQTACDTCKIQFKCAHRLNSLRGFHPQVDNGVRVRVTGTNPYRDNLILHIDFEDRNKEGRASFQAILDRFAKSVDSTQSKSNKTSTDSTKTDAQAALSLSQKAEKFIPAFQSEMTRFYQEKYNADHLTAGFLAQCVTHIQDNIKKHFEIPAATPQLMRQKLEEWLEKSKLDKEKFRTMLNDGIEYYQKILNYHTTSAWIFQVRDNDITKLGFDWYRDGKRVSANPQTFEFFNRGGFTIDYSVGIIINGLVNHAFTTLGFVDSMGTTKYRVVRQLGSNKNIGPALLAHAYYRYPVWNRFKIGATTGFMTNTRDNDFGFNFLFGGSLLFGSKERFNLSSGVVLGKVARLREGLEENVTVLDAPLSGQTTDVPTRDVYRCKWFVGVTYNLGR